MPDGLAALAELGVRLPQDKTEPFHGIRFLDDERSVAARFAQGHGLGVRRTVLHQVLVDAAVQAGVEFEWGARVAGLTRGGVLLRNREIRCRWVVGADGLNSRVRTWAGLDRNLSSTLRFGHRSHYAVRPWSDMVEVHWTGNGQLYVTPVSGREICVALVTRDRNLPVTEAMAGCSSLPRELREALPSTREQGAITANRRLHSVVSGNCALLGEASGCVDAVTGQGLSLAFRQALALEKALRAGDLRVYERAHRRLMRLPTTMAGLLLLMDRRHNLRKRTLRAFSSQPELFGRLLAVHTGPASPLEFGLRGATSLGWHMLTA